MLNGRNISNFFLQPPDMLSVKLTLVLTFCWNFSFLGCSRQTGRLLGPGMPSGQGGTAGGGVGGAERAHTAAEIRLANRYTAIRASPPSLSRYSLSQIVHLLAISIEHQSYLLSPPVFIQYDSKTRYIFLKHTFIIHRYTWKEYL